MQIQCPVCYQAVPFDDERAGESTFCPHCGHALQLPPSPPAPPVAPSPKRVARQPAAEESEEDEQPASPRWQLPSVLGFSQFFSPKIAAVLWVVSLVAAVAWVVAAGVYVVAFAQTRPVLDLETKPINARTLLVTIQNPGPVAAQAVTVDMTMPRGVEISIRDVDPSQAEMTTLLNGATRLVWAAGELDSGEVRRMRVFTSEELKEAPDMSYRCKAVLTPTAQWLIGGAIASVPLVVLAILVFRMVLEAALTLRRIERYLHALATQSGTSRQPELTIRSSRSSTWR